MSEEIQLGWPCPHFVVEEPVTLGIDRMTVGTKSPVASQKSMSILVNDTHYVPSEGLYSQALLTGSFSGPFQVRRCDTLAGPDANVLTIQTSAGTITVNLPTGDRVPLSRIISSIRLADPDGIVAVGSFNGALRLLDNTSIGEESFIRVSGQGAEAVGWVEQKGTRGKMLYPPWTLRSEESVYPSPHLANALTVTARYPMFKRPLKTNPTLRVSYVSTPERCPRCNGTYVENDYRFDKSGGVVIIRNEDLLYQTCMKAMLTELASNPFHPAYGSKIMSRIGAKRIGDSAMLIKQDISNALKKVQGIQTKLRQFQNISLREMLYKIISVDVVQGDDPTTFLVSAVVQNAAAKPINLKVVYTAPGAVALGGSNGLALGVTGAGLGTDQV